MSLIFEERKAVSEKKNPPLIEKLNEMGATIATLGGNCPVQIEGKIGDKDFYFRARGNHWSVQIGDEKDFFTPQIWYYEEEYGQGPFEAGWMEEYEALEFLIQAINLYKKEIDNTDKVPV